MIVLTIPIPPTVNHMYGQIGTRKYLKKAAHNFRRAVMEAMADVGNGFGDARVAVFARVFPPNRREFDLDNRWKSLLDALECAGAFDNDCQADVLWMQRGDVFKGGKCNVVIVTADRWEDGLERIRD